MNDLLRASIRLAGLALLAWSLAGCPNDRSGFDVGTRPDDDDSEPDDDDDSVETPPVITFQSTEPDLSDGDSFAGPLKVDFSIDDPDSAAVIVAVLFGLQGEDTTVFEAAHLVGDTDNIVEVTGEAPMQGLLASATWDTLEDIPTVASDPALQLCPTDEEGNAGDCIFVEFNNAAVVNTGLNDLGAFCQPGHMESMYWDAGEAVVPLSDGHCLNLVKSDPPAPSDYSARFALVLVNPDDGDVTFEISAMDPPDIGDDDDSAAGDDDSAAPPPPPPRGMRPLLTRPLARDLAGSGKGRLPPRSPPPALECTPDLTQADVHDDQVTFEARDVIDDKARDALGADLYALGDHIAIYVDNETPIDWDSDCADPSNAIEPSDMQAFGFDNCDLDEVVAVFDNNIWPTLTTLYGEPSDIDANCRVTVLLTHRLNRLTLTNSDEKDDARLVKSYAEPDIDLWADDLTLNPGSNEQEILFLYAPDPVGFWNNQTVQLDEYLNFEVNGRIAIAMQDLISYGVHREVTDTLLDPSDPDDLAHPPQEEDWLNDAMGLLAADVTGFGAIAYPDSWIYMDRSHLLGLMNENTLEDFDDRGGQFLFMRYLHDLYGDAVISDILHAQNADLHPTQGIDSIVAVLQAYGYVGNEHPGSDPTDAGEVARLLFGDFSLQWAVAMAVSGLTNEAGGQLVPDSVVPNFSEPGFVSVANPAVPVPGELYGANGYQQGFDVHGLNLSFSGGSDPAGATELTDLRVMTENLDQLLYHPQADFFGKVAGHFGVAVVLVSGLEQPVNWLQIETADAADLVGNVIRLNDASPYDPLLTLEDVDGAKFTTVKPLVGETVASLDALLIDGSVRNVIGRIDPSEVITVSPIEDAPEPGDDDDAARDWEAEGDDDSAGPVDEDVIVTDTDRYGFSLAGVATLGIWVDRRIASLAGDVALADPFVAVLPASDVPDAFDYSQWGFGPTPSDGVCWDPTLYSYPVVMPGWLGAQANLSSDPEADVADDFEIEVWSDELEWPCDLDHDQDGIPDEWEPLPANLLEQILLRQAENLLLDPDFYQPTFGAIGGFGDVSMPWWGAKMIDIDSNEQPDDDFATAMPSSNLGGRAAETGEEALWVGTLPPGDYVIVVGGASDSVGPYDLSVRLVL